MNDIDDLSELIQDDIITLCDGYECDDNFTDILCQVVVDRIKEYKDKKMIQTTELDISTQDV